jgi:hypothetical protein
MRQPRSAWSEAELEDAILKLCEEFPDARMAALARALEQARQSTPRGSIDSLRSAMRQMLQHDKESQRAI